MPLSFHMKDLQKQKLIEALIEKPSIYDIDVIDNSMLPDAIKNEKTITIEIKPPTMEVLSMCALPMFRIPESIRESKDLKVEDALKHVNEMVEVLAILSHGKSTNYPDWYVPFFRSNLSSKELYMIFYESTLKLQTDFFLKSFQIVSQNNPMMMNEKTEDLTHTNS